MRGTQSRSSNLFLIFCFLLKIRCSAVALFFIVAGASHFTMPEPYLAIMPSFLPWPEALVAISGMAEIAGGCGILFVRTRKLAVLWLLALLIAVFPANIYATFHGMQIFGRAVPAWILWIRLSIQPLLMWWVYNACWKAQELPR